MTQTAPEQTLPSRPHVLLVTVDHWPGSLLGVNQRRCAVTPTLDQLTRLGTRFTRTYSECPVCIPARRTLMTGTSARTHGDREFKPAEPMPALPTLAQTFRDAGYQTFAAGKLHVFPQRDRIGFDDAMIMEEGRPQLGAPDDYDTFLGEQGFAGQQYGHGLSNNDYQWRPWHLPEHCHPINWTSLQMAKAIKRRDPTRPGFWYLSYSSPHPPLAPLQAYLDLYRDRPIDDPIDSEWSDTDTLPYALRAIRNQWPVAPQDTAAVRRAFYALCTHIDHQLRTVIGTLREERILDDTIIVFTSDHGDMLGDHRLWAKRLFYESSARVPMIVVDVAHSSRIAAGATDDRLVGLRDVMPTLLDLAGVAVPDSVEGLSMAGDRTREDLYGEYSVQSDATRMITNDRYKLIYYPFGNTAQLFDLSNDPDERTDLWHSADHLDVRTRLSLLLVDEMHGTDAAWVTDGELTGAPEPHHLPGRRPRPPWCSRAPLAPATARPGPVTRRRRTATAGGVAARPRLA